MTIAQNSLLGIAREFCKRQRLPVPDTVVGASDDETLQIWGLMNEGIYDLVERFNWQQLQRKITFHHNQLDVGAGETYGALYVGQNPNVPTAASLLDWKYLVKDSFWSKTDRLPVYGPVTDPQWMQMTTMQVTPTRYAFRLKFNYIEVYPVKTIPLFELEYGSNAGVYHTLTAQQAGLGVHPTGADGGGPTDFAQTIFLQTYSDDTDTCRLPWNIVIQDLKWRWRKEKGFPYAEDQRQCEEMVLRAQLNEPAKTLVMDGGSPDMQTVGPGLLVSAGSWPV